MLNPASVVLLYNLTHKILTCDKRLAEGRTTGALKAAVSFPEESIAVG